VLSGTSEPAGERAPSPPMPKRARSAKGGPSDPGAGTPAAKRPADAARVARTTAQAAAQPPRPAAPGVAAGPPPGAARLPGAVSPAGAGAAPAGTAPSPAPRPETRDQMFQAVLREMRRLPHLSGFREVIAKRAFSQLCRRHEKGGGDILQSDVLGESPGRPPGGAGGVPGRRPRRPAPQRARPPPAPPRPPQTCWTTCRCRWRPFRRRRTRRC